MHIGILEQDSPSLAQNLKRYLKADEIAQVALAYELSCRYGSLNEFKVERDKSMSFNPRPARVAQILITEIRCCEAVTLSCAMLGCADLENLESLPDKFADLHETFRGLKNILSFGPAAPSSAAIEAALFAIFLDRVRHLHMARNDIIYIENQINVIEKQMRIKSSFQENERLRSMIENAIGKLRKIIAENEQTD